MIKKMVKKMIKEFSILVMAGLLLVPVLAWTAPAPDMMKHARMGIHLAENNLFPPHMLLKHKDEIGLTQDQVGKIEKMQQQFQETMIKREAELKIMELKFHSLLKNEKVDRKLMEKMIRETATLRTNMQIDKMNFLLDVRDILTPEQITKIEEFKKNMRMHRQHPQRYRDRMGKGKRCPAGPVEDKGN